MVVWLSKRVGRPLGLDTYLHHPDFAGEISLDDKDFELAKHVS